VFFAPLAVFFQFQPFFVEFFVLLRKIINSLADTAFKFNQLLFVFSSHKNNF